MDFYLKNDKNDKLIIVHKLTNDEVTIVGSKVISGQ